VNISEELPKVIILYTYKGAIMTESEKTEKVYVYPEENPYAERGRLGEGYLEYKKGDFKLFLPIVELAFVDEEDADATWGGNFTPNWAANKLTRGIGNDLDNKMPAMIKAMEDAGDEPQTIANALQDYVGEYGVAQPRSSASAETKRKANVVKEAEGLGLTEAEIREILKREAEKKAAEA
jgi:hypothetical protein